MEERLESFFHLSLKGKIHLFDFDGFFKEFTSILHERLALNSQLTFEEYKEWADGVYSKNPLEEYTIFTSWNSLTKDHIFEAVCRCQYNSQREALSGMYEDLLSLYKKLETASNLSISDKVLLVDECIHAQHVTGEILEDCDPDEIRERVKQLWNGEE